MPKKSSKSTLIDRVAMLTKNTATDEEILKKYQKIAEEFEQSLAEEPAFSLAGTHLSLSDYLAAVKLVIDDSFDHEVWVRAEIRAMNTKGGHYYFELAEMDDDENVAASCRATLWRFRAKSVLAKFTAVTGQTLNAGASVLVKCSANFHAQYGFSLNISDIDPNYTLGELAAAYQAMKKRLEEEGLLNLNKKLPSPFDIRDVVVIAPEKAAGLGDFRAEADRLAAAQACRFHYHSATFQGNQAPEEIRRAMVAAMEGFLVQYQHLPDLMVIIRGGGAVGDLAYLNNYELAALVAECPVPVWVGVGHEKDTVILDEVAHRSFDTPSKVVLGIESHLIGITSGAKNLMANLTKLATARLSAASQNNQRQLERIQRTSSHAVTLAKKDTLFQMKHLQNNTRFQRQRQKHHLDLIIKRIKHSSQAHITLAKKDSRLYLNQHRSVFNYLSNLRNDCRHLQSLILIQHPKHTLMRGYALVHGTDQDERIIDRVEKLTKGQTIRLSFHDGDAIALISDVEPEQHKL